MSTQPITTCDFCSPSKRKTGANNWWTIDEENEWISITPFNPGKVHVGLTHTKKDACGRACVNSAIAAFMDKIENRRDPKAHLKEGKPSE